jgi:glucosylceramidase
MKSRLICLYALLLLSVLLWNHCAEPSNELQFNTGDQKAFVTAPDTSKRFTRMEGLFQIENLKAEVRIEIEPSKKYQTMDGFGYTLTGGSARLLWKMSEVKRAILLRELFSDDEEAIGVSYLRISLGASDLDEKVFSYNDLPSGTKDMTLENFSMEEDLNDLIPVLKEILVLNPNMPIMASPWSAPVWMKTNGSSIGGSLKREYYGVYADYFVKYINSMASEGITIDAVTVQNEPLHPGNNPSMYMTWEEQHVFVRDYLGPKFETAGLETKIVIYDHNPDHIEYPINIMNDPQAKKYIDGSAFHLYGGGIDDLAIVHEAHPDKNIYFTEQWIGAPGNYEEDIKWHIRNVFIGGSRNWCKAILEWNLAADPNLDPHTDGGCTRCLGALTINGDEVTRHPAYYIVAHASKFVSPGSVRIGSTDNESLSNVAFLTPENNLVLLVTNNKNTELTFNVDQGSSSFSSKLPAGAVATYIWKYRN